MSKERSTTKLIMALCSVLILGIAGCTGDDGARGPAGTAGPPGTPGGGGTPGTDGSPGTLGQLRPTVTVTDAYIGPDNRPVVEFEVETITPWGSFAWAPPPASVEFTIARLVPIGGAYHSWQSYLTSASGNNTPQPGLLQASQVRGNHAQGTWEALGGNAYRYTLPVNVTQIPSHYSAPGSGFTVDDWPAYSPADTHRVVVLLRPGSTWDAAYHFLDFVPTGDAPALKRSVATASCNGCHDNLSAHGNNRIGVETCSNCHNQFTLGGYTGQPVDLAYLGHELHSAGGIAQTEQFLRPRWTGVGFPRDIRTCESCHNPTAAPGAELVYAQASVEACASCHDNDAGHLSPRARGFYPGDAHWKNPATTCTGCHNATHATHSVAIMHQDPARQFARDGDLHYQIEAMDLVGSNLTVDWRLLHAGNPVVAGVDGWGMTATLRIGWLDDGGDFSHSNPSSTRPGAPLEIGIAASITAGTTTQTGGLYTTEVDLSSAGFSDNLVATLGGNVSATGFAQLVAANGIFHLTENRRQIVSLAQCSTCHEDRHSVFNKHGGARHNDPRQCVMCHNNNSTDAARRFAVGRVNPPVGDIAVEAPTNFMVMIHSIHGAKPDYALPGNGLTAWSTWGDLRYPAQLANCSQCHVGDSYRLDNLGPRGTTIDSLAGTENPFAVDLHLKTTAATAACGSCHDDRPAREHMRLMGGNLSISQTDIDATVYETCSTCHGAGRSADVRLVHGL